MRLRSGVDVLPRSERHVGQCPFSNPDLQRIPSDLNVGLEQPIANGAKRTVLPGGGRKQVSLSRRVLPRGP